MMCPVSSIKYKSHFCPILLALMLNANIINIYFFMYILYIWFEKERGWLREYHRVQYNRSSGCVCVCVQRLVFEVRNKPDS